MSKDKVKFVYGKDTVELDVVGGTLGPKVVDIRKFYGDTGMFTFDPGYTSTASCESKITFIDGDKGTLLYRGYPIEQLAEKSDFMEVSYLLLFGDRGASAVALRTPRGRRRLGAEDDG